jgi:predicted acylesterase/phospholipase RssA
MLAKLFQHRAMQFVPHRPTVLARLARALLAAVITLSFAVGPSHAQSAAPRKKESTTTSAKPASAARKKTPAPNRAAKKEEPASKGPKIPPRESFTAAEAAAAVIPGIADARFWGDSEQDFERALPTVKGPWLALSSGGADGAFGAGVFVGLSAANQRPEFSLVTGVSTGALMAPYIFAGAKYDEQLRSAYTSINAGDVFELGSQGSESFFDTWPLRELIAKLVTPELLADVAAEHRKGRRLFVVTTDVDAERPMVWNMGAIAAAGGEDALKLFRQVLLAAGSIPGAFPPVLIEVESGGKRFHEMHADGGMCAQFYVAPESLLAATRNYTLPATELYVVINTQLRPDFQVTERSLIGIVGRGVSTIVKTLTRVMLQRAYVVAKQSGITFNVATIPSTFNEPSRGAFDTAYMKVLFDVGFEQGKGGSAFAHEPPALFSTLNAVTR